MRAQEADAIGVEHLSFLNAESSGGRAFGAASLAFEKRFLAESLAAHGGNRTRTARALVHWVFDYYTKLYFSTANKIHKIHALRMVSGKLFFV